MPDLERDALDAVRAQLDEAHAAADRLVREAQRQAEGATGGPAEQIPRGGGTGGGGAPPARPDLGALLALVRDAIPPELSIQLAEALRELLLAVRALIDWYLERLGEPAPDRGQVEVEDIPLD